MAKTGWQDRAPYQSSPETEALLSTSRGTDNYVEGKRPSMTVGLSSPTWFGSNSDALYMKGAEFRVPEFDLTGQALPTPTKFTMDRTSNNYSKDINGLLQKNKITQEDAKPVQDALKTYKNEPTYENFLTLSIRQQVATQIVPNINDVIGGLSEEDQKGLQGALKQYNKDPAPENYKRLIDAYSPIQSKKTANVKKQKESKA